MQMLTKYDQERMGVGGSTGDSNTGEQSQDSNVWDRNPAETAIVVETVVFDSTQQNSSGNQYKMLARKVCEHLKKSGTARSIERSEAE